MPSLPAYRHAQFYVVLWIILGLSAGASVLVSGRGAGAWLSRYGVEDGLILSLLGGGLLLLGRLVISIDEQAVRWSFGYLGWPAWHVPLVEIAGVEPARTTWFGSGIKGSGKHRHYSVSMGSPAVRLHLHDGRTVTLGTPEPERLKAFIEARLPRSRR